MHRIRVRLLVGVVTTLALVLSGCAGDGADTDAAGDEAATGDAADDTTAEDGDDGEATDGEADTDDERTMAGAAVAVAASDLGDIVVDGEGRTLYMFVPDEGGEPTCTDDCAQTWPVLEGPATAGDGVDASLLSTADHPSGATQVTYGGWPLYHFANDASPGDTNGQGINDVWYVLGPDGEPIRDESAAGGQDAGY